MKTNHTFVSYLKDCILGLFCCFVFIGNAQSNTETSIYNNYKSYSELPRETAYGHLNKSTLITGESLGFSIYLFDKYTKRSSINTKNVYCTIQDASGKTIKQKMILASNGVASGVFEVDSLFASGNYVFKAYTNWMRNFDEQNFYVQHLKIINPEHDNTPQNDDEEYDDIDAQFLPEGGHLLLDVKNTVGVVVKDDYGFGVPNLKGRITDGYDVEISTFETNAFGIAKFEFTPKSRRIYTVTFNDDEQTSLTLDSGELKGITMNLVDLQDKVAIVFRTNAITLPEIANTSYILAFSNGNQLNVTDLTFNGNSEITTVINRADLFSGMNIITLFDDTNTPILERLYFNHDGINRIKTQTPKVVRAQDSIQITIPVNTIDPSKFHNLSVSVLPKDTKSYQHHHNIMSSTFLQPYVKGRIENARYYFTDITKKKTYELDNLLLTQGWSSYDWSTVFNSKPTKRFDFEDGITINASLNNTKGTRFVIYPQKNTPTITVNLKDGERDFKLKGLLPINNEILKIGVIAKKNRVEKPGLYVQLFPSEIPKLERSFASMKYRNNKAFKYDASLPILDESWNTIEALDTVQLSVRKEEERIEKIKRLNKGNLYVFNDVQRKNTTDFASFISSKGFNVFQDPRDPRSLIIQTNKRTTFQDSTDQQRPLIYLNDFLVSQDDHRVLMDVDMSTMDYVIVDKSGLGQGMRGSNGVIKIFTNSELRTKEYEIIRDAGQVIKVPLSFSVNKTFYTPTYSSYKNDFFKHYGVIDWFDNCSIDEQGYVSLKIKDTKNDQIKLYIEGIANDGSFISEEKIIRINKL